MNDILVSEVCITYNHEKFISQAIESFLSQKTSFKFEIVIHDDCSNDQTSQIIKNFKMLYPDTIKIISQTVNQFSKGKRVYPIAFDYCKGEYLALCDGDDYWVSNKKLQLQVEALQVNKSLDLCFHDAFNLFPNGKFKNFNSGFNRIYLSNIKLFFQKLKLTFFHNKSNYRVVSAEKVIEMGGEFAHTGSLLIRSSALNDLPNFIRTAPVSDYYLQIISSVRGGAIYINKSMSVYRMHSSGVSWSSSMNNLHKRKKWLIETVKTNEMLDEYYEYRFNKSFNFINSSCYCNMSLFYLLNGMFDEYSNLIQVSRNFDNQTNKVYCLFIYWAKPLNWIFLRLINFSKNK